MAMKRLSGSELARAVVKQLEAQKRAAARLQLAWMRRKVGCLGVGVGVGVVQGASFLLG